MLFEKCFIFDEQNPQIDWLLHVSSLLHLQTIFYVCINSSLEWLYSWTQLNEKCSDPMNGPVLEINTSNRLNIFNKLLELLFCQMKGGLYS